MSGSLRRYFVEQIRAELKARCARGDCHCERHDDQAEKPDETESEQS